MLTALRSASAAPPTHSPPSGSMPARSASVTPYTRRALWLRMFSLVSSVRAG